MNHTTSIESKLPRLVLALFLPILVWGSDTFAQSKTTKYTYDALGRLTFVEDSQNGNRDYDYDRVGNRLRVEVGTATDASAEPPPPLVTPNGLSSSYVANCTWSAGWSSVQGATHYVFGETQGAQRVVSATSTTVSCSTGYPNSNKPHWVRACSASGCSPKAYFP